MILAVDIGNTTISAAIMENTRTRRVYTADFMSPGGSVVQRMRVFLKRIQESFPLLEDVIVCSVVPQHLKRLTPLIKELWRKPTVVIGKDIHVPIANRYLNPKQVGQDRLVGAFAAKYLYGAPCIVIDFGTAITFDIISSRGAYEGGIIVPGIRLSAESLFHKTALLPRIKDVRRPRQLIGKSTDESILSGLFYGYAAMCNGLITALSKKFKKKPKVIVTGGHLALMKKFIAAHISEIDEQLVFKGIALVYAQSS